MNSKIIDVVLAVASVFFWYQPFNSVSNDLFGNDFGGAAMYQSGEHIGGMAYLMLIVPLVFAYFSWVKNQQIQFIAAGAQLLLCALFILPRLMAGNVRFGIVALTVLAGVMMYRSYMANEVKDEPKSDENNQL